MHPRYLLALLLAAAPSPLVAQDPAAPYPPGRLTVAVHVGFTGEAASPGIEAAMIENGYGAPGGYGRCERTLYCPLADPQAPAIFQLSVRYRVRSPFAAELLVGQSAGGLVEGDRGDRLAAEYDGLFIAPLASFGTTRPRTKASMIFHAGVGPALLRSQWKYTLSSSFSPTPPTDRDRATTTSMGAICNGTVAMHFNRVLHFDITGQYRWFSGADVRPPRWSPGDRTARVNNSHGFIGVGLGVTF